MIFLKFKSLKEKREKETLTEELEQDITDLELRDIEKDQTITELELEIVKLQENKEEN